MEEIRRVSFCVLVDEGRALLVHRHAGRRLFPDVWDLPGGHVEPGETPDETARREVAEEVGVTVVDLELVDVPVDAPGAVTHVYLALGWHGEPANAAPHEHDQIGWFTPAEAELLRLAVPEVAAILRAAVAGASDPAGAAADTGVRIPALLRGRHERVGGRVSTPRGGARAGPRPGPPPATLAPAAAGPRAGADAGRGAHPGPRRRPRRRGLGGRRAGPPPARGGAWRGPRPALVRGGRPSALGLLGLPGLRPLLGGRLASTPYRFAGRVTSDADAVLRLVACGRAEDAVRRYTGPLLPRSGSLGIELLRAELHQAVRGAALRAGGAALALWCSRDVGEGDAEALGRYVATLSPLDPVRLLVQARLAQSQEPRDCNPHATSAAEHWPHG